MRIRIAIIFRGFTVALTVRAIPVFSNTTTTTAAAAAAAAAAATFHLSNDTTPPTPNPGPCDCLGGSMCGTLHISDCDYAINAKLIRTDDIKYGAEGSTSPHQGVCHGLGTDYGCGIVIQGGRHCVASGNQMWWDYQDIRDHGCHHCGHKYWGSGCSTVVDYFPVCDEVH
ncbi:uncharacterized protein GGS25DRAFT_524831 [Hypoxylon fragiforme]|uniref:uncharacterized protein n=1 Tax=Hypoxylon fragiforme TaxID=63214 RepID=UPI0020C69B79|nr:uncharacterized protein GGS25DRAFT_524831 [Hypoxylon fragiforme]KAI2605314.1 hypothetical protein GGS25DRAFT_524831 [Hypoxylon fragiforme]